MNKTSKKCGTLLSASIFEEIMADNFSNLLKNNNLHIQEAQPTPGRKTQRDPQTETS